MYKIFEYSHLGGSEILQLRYPAINAEIDAVIESIRDVRRIKESREKTMKGVMLYSENVYGYQMEKFREVFGCPILTHFGHSERVLMAASMPDAFVDVSDTLTRAIRGTDLAIQWSKEELLVVLPGLNGTEARQVVHWLIAGKRSM